MLADKAGVSHFHVGLGKRKLASHTELLEYAPNIKPELLHPTHINRTAALLAKAVEFTKKGCIVDMETTDEELHKGLETYKRVGGKLSNLTISSDAVVTSPRNILSQIQKCVRARQHKLPDLLQLTCTNPAKILKFKNCGELKVG